MGLSVLYEDNHVIAVYKPAGVLVQGDKSGDLCLMDEVKTYLKEKYNKPGNVFLGLVHRLDRPVAGIVLFAKTSKGASRLSKQIREHEWHKVYHAVVEGEIKQGGTLVHWIRKDENKNKVDVFTTSRSDSLRAELSYEVVEVKAGKTLVKIHLKTGRPHQIRAQFSTIGHPLVGDVKYGAKQALPDQSIMLAATSLTFQLPTKDEVKTLEIPVPFQL